MLGRFLCFPHRAAKAWASRKRNNPSFWFSQDTMYWYLGFLITRRVNSQSWDEVGMSGGSKRKGRKERWGMWFSKENGGGQPPSQNFIQDMRIPLISESSTWIGGFGGFFGPCLLRWSNNREKNSNIVSLQHTTCVWDVVYCLTTKPQHCIPCLC